MLEYEDIFVPLAMYSIFVLFMLIKWLSLSFYANEMKMKTENAFIESWTQDLPLTKRVL